MNASSPAINRLMCDRTKYKVPLIIGLTKNDCQIGLSTRDCDANQFGKQMVIKATPELAIGFHQGRTTQNSFVPAIEAHHVLRLNAVSRRIPSAPAPRASASDLWPISLLQNALWLSDCGKRKRARVIYGSVGNFGKIPLD